MNNGPRALEAYFADRERRGSKGLAKDRAAANVRILPEVGELDVLKLTTKRIRDWHTDLATAPKLTRSGRFPSDRETKAVDPKDADAVRARRATANRTLTVKGRAQPRLSREPRRFRRSMAQSQAVPRGGCAHCAFPVG